MFMKLILSMLCISSLLIAAQDTLWTSNFILRDHGTVGVSIGKNQNTSPYISVSPNPFNPSTVIKVNKVYNNISLKIYSIAGAMVRDLSNEFNNGKKSYLWNASSHGSGIYLIKLITPDGISLTQKLLLLK